MNKDKNIITTAPIEINELKKYFSDKTISYTIDYANSKLQGIKLLTYLSNLDLPCDIMIDQDSLQFRDLLSVYLNAPFIVSVPVLEIATIEMLLEYRNLIEGDKYNTFIKDNEEIISHWSSILDSMAVYNMYTVQSKKLGEWATNRPHNDTDTTVGINFVSLFKYSGFYMYYKNVKQEDMQFYDSYFNQNMFKGTSLFHYWANNNNPIFLLTFGVAEKIFSVENYIPHHN